MWLAKWLRHPWLSTGRSLYWSGYILLMPLSQTVQQHFSQSAFASSALDLSSYHILKYLTSHYITHEKKDEEEGEKDVEGEE